MLIELVYHLWSPKYRKGDPIDDPLHVVPFDVDAAEPGGHEARQLRARTILRQETLDKIERHQKDDEDAGFTWPFSTHKNLHGAAVNGILAGETWWKGSFRPRRQYTAAKARCGSGSGYFEVCDIFLCFVLSVGFVSVSKSGYLRRLLVRRPQQQRFSSQVKTVSVGGCGLHSHPLYP